MAETAGETVTLEARLHLAHALQSQTALNLWRIPRWRAVISRRPIPTPMRGWARPDRATTRRAGRMIRAWNSPAVWRIARAEPSARRAKNWVVWDPRCAKRRAARRI